MVKDQKNDLNIIEALYSSLPLMTTKNMKFFLEGNGTAALLTFIPKSSKTLSVNLFKDTFATSDVLSLVLKAHLYYEIIIDAIIQDKLKHPEGILKYNFSRKIEVLHAQGILSDFNYSDLKTLNNLRNKFAHNLNYDIASFDLSQFNDLSQVYKIKDYKRQYEKRLLNFFILKMEILALLWNMTGEFNVVYLLDI